MAIELTQHPRAIWIGQQLARRPELYWNEMLSYEDKLLIYRSSLVLDTVPDELIQEFEQEMASNGEFGVKEQMKAVAENKIKELTE